MNKLTFCILELTFFLNMSFFSLPIQAQSQSNNDLLELVAPQWETSNAPRRRSGGGKRGDNLCKNSHGEDFKLTAIAPENVQGLTVKSNPIFYFFFPLKSETKLQYEFSIFELQADGQKGTKIEKRTNEWQNLSVIAIQVQSDKTLNINQDYSWNLTVICNPNDRAEDLTVEGVIRRVELSPNLFAQIDKATPEQKVLLYAKAGIWYETVASIFAEDLCQNNPRLANSLWIQLIKLESVKLDDLEKNFSPCLSAK